MLFINKFKDLVGKSLIFEKYSFYLNEARKNPAANLDRSPLFAIFPLTFVPFMQYGG